MSVTLATLRQNMAKDHFRYPAGVSFTTTSAGAAGGTTAVCSTLSGIATTDDVFIGWWILLTSGTYGATGTVAARERLVTDYATSTGTLTFAAYAGQVATSVTFELYPYQPSTLVTFLNRSKQMAYPWLSKTWDDRNLVTGNMLLSSHFEDWASSSVPDNWTGGYTDCTVTEETTIKRFGSSSAKIVRASSTGAALSISSASIPLLLDQSEKTVDFYGWCYSATGSTCQLKLTPSTGTAGESGYQDDGAVWQFLEIEGYSVPDDINLLTVSLEMDAAATAYWDNVALFGDEPYEYLLPTGIVKVSQVYLGNDWEEMEYRDEYELPHSSYDVFEKNGYYYLRFRAAPPQKRKLRIMGVGFYDDLSSDTDSWTIDDKKALTLVKGAASLVFSSNAMGKGVDERDRLLRDSDRLRAEFENSIRMTSNLRPVSRYSRPESWD